MTQPANTTRRTLLFAPCAYNLAETSRMIEIAKAVRAHPRVRRLSTSGSFPRVARSSARFEDNGFPMEIHSWLRFSTRKLVCMREEEGLSAFGAPVRYTYFTCDAVRSGTPRRVFYGSLPSICMLRLQNKERRYE